MKRFDENIRNKIYQTAEFVALDSQTVIIKQGDIGDKLYIILKGRVAVEITSPELANMPVVVTTLNDGDQFGELSLIKMEKIQDNSKQDDSEIGKKRAT